jgi:hypoxanthine phosphoribosyltransferase
MTVTETERGRRSQIDIVPSVEDREYQVGEVLLDEKQILARVDQLAERLRLQYKDEKVVFLYLVDGATPFTADFVRAFEEKGGNHVDSVAMRSSSYGTDETSSGKPEIALHKKLKLEGKHLVIIDDIIDTGNTFQRTLDFLGQDGNPLVEGKPLSIKTMAFLDKPSKRKVPVNADYVGFTIPGVWVKGYGMDSKGMRSFARRITADGPYKPEPRR